MIRTGPRRGMINNYLTATIIQEKNNIKKINFASLTEEDSYQQAKEHNRQHEILAFNNMNQVITSPTNMNGQWLELPITSVTQIPSI